MTLEELTGLTGYDLASINQAYSAPIRRMRHLITIGQWVSGTPYRGDFYFSGRIVSGIKELKISTDAAGFPLGKSLCSSLDLEFQNSLNLTETRLKKSVFVIETGISIDGGKTYIDLPVGIFYPASVKSSDNWKTVKVEGYDEMHFLNDKKLGSNGGTLYSHVKNIWPSMSIKTYELLQSITLTKDEAKILKDYSAREAFGYIGAKYGGFFKIDRNGDLSLAKMVHNKTVYNYRLKDKYDFQADEESKFYTGIRIGTENSYDEYFENPEYGNVIINISSPLISTGAESLSSKLYNTVFECCEEFSEDYTYLDYGCFHTGKLSMRGNPIFEIGQSINFRDRWGQHKKIIPTAITYDIVGGKMDLNANEFEEELMSSYSDEYADKAYVNEAIESSKEETKEELNSYYDASFSSYLKNMGYNAAPKQHDYPDILMVNYQIRFASHFLHNTDGGDGWHKTTTIKDDGWNEHLDNAINLNSEATEVRDIILKAHSEDRLFVTQFSYYDFLPGTWHSILFDYNLSEADGNHFNGNASVYYCVSTKGLLSMPTYYNDSVMQGNYHPGKYTNSHFNSLLFSPDIVDIENTGSGRNSYVIVFVVLETATSTEVSFKPNYFQIFPIDRTKYETIFQLSNGIYTDYITIQGPFLNIGYPTNEDIQSVFNGDINSTNEHCYTKILPGCIIIGDNVQGVEVVLTPQKIASLLALIE